MPALRKSSIQLPLSFEPAPERDGPRLAGDHAATHSPALALRDHLAARLEELTPAVAGNAIAIEQDKLPMPARVGVIIGLSAALWFSIYLAASAIV